jgi:hypothetical protein
VLDPVGAALGTAARVRITGRLQARLLTAVSGPVGVGHLEDAGVLDRLARAGRRERLRQDDADQAAAGDVPAGFRRDPGRRRAADRYRADGVAVAVHGGVPGLRPVPPAGRRVGGRGGTARLSDEPAAVAARAGAGDLPNQLPDGLATRVGTVFTGGHGLSGGQWQKLALSRAMRRDDPLLVVLDEPTASLDAPSEHALFERYAEAAVRARGGPARSPCSSRTGSRPSGWPI